MSMNKEEKLNLLRELESDIDKKIALMKELGYTKENNINIGKALQELRKVDFELKEVESERERFFCTFRWETGSFNDNLIKQLRTRNINYSYSKYRVLQAEIDGKKFEFNYEVLFDRITTKVYIKEVL